MKADLKDAVSDIALRRAPPPEREPGIRALTGCIAGAILTSTYKKWLENAGFVSVEIIDTKSDLNVYRDLRAPDVEKHRQASSGSCCGGSHAVPQDTDFDVNEYAVSVRVLAIK